MCNNKKKSALKDSELLNLVKTSILPLYDLTNASVEEIKVKNTDKHRAVYKISFKDKIFCLKKLYYSEENLLFVYSAIEWLFRNNLKVPNLIYGIEKKPFVCFNGLLFILTPWIEGTKCDFDDFSCIEKAAVTLGKFHKATQNFFPIDGSYIKESYDNLYISTNKHFLKLLQCFNDAQRKKDKFSKIFLNNFDSNIELAKYSLEISASINFNNLSKSLCHGDYVGKNLICKEDEMWIIDFDKCSLNYSIFDLSYFLRRLLKRSGTIWSVEAAKKALLSYDSVVNCTKDDIKYLLAYIAFPQKYWRVSKDYYNNIKKCNRSAFLDVLNNNVKSVESQKEFVRDFSDFCHNHFEL